MSVRNGSRCLPHSSSPCLTPVLSAPDWVQPLRLEARVYLGAKRKPLRSCAPWGEGKAPSRTLWGSETGPGTRDLTFLRINSGLWGRAGSHGGDLCCLGARTVPAFDIILSPGKSHQERRPSCQLAACITAFIILFYLFFCASCICLNYCSKCMWPAGWPTNNNDADVGASRFRPDLRIILEVFRSDALYSSRTVTTDWMWVVFCISGSVGLFLLYRTSLIACRWPRFFAPLDEVRVMFSLNPWNARIGDQWHSAQCPLCFTRLPGWGRAPELIRKVLSEISLFCLNELWHSDLFVFAQKSSLAFLSCVRG